MANNVIDAAIRLRDFIHADREECQCQPGVYEDSDGSGETIGQQFFR